MLHFVYSKQLDVEDDSGVFEQMSSAGIAAYDDNEDCKDGSKHSGGDRGPPSLCPRTAPFRG